MLDWLLYLLLEISTVTAGVLVGYVLLALLSVGYDLYISDYVKSFLKASVRVLKRLPALLPFKSKQNLPNDLLAPYSDYFNCRCVTIPLSDDSVAINNAEVDSKRIDDLERDMANVEQVLYDFKHELTALQRRLYQADFVDKLSDVKKRNKKTKRSKSK